MSGLEITTQITTIVGLAVVIFEIWQTGRWNRRVSNFNFINTEVSAKLELEARRAIETAGIAFEHTPGWRLTSADAEKLIGDREASFAINQFLNDYQNLCAAYQASILDKRMFRRVHSGRLLFWYRILEEYLTQARVQYGDPQIWSDFATAAAKLR